MNPRMVPDDHVVVLHCLPTLQIGGARTVVFELVRAMEPLGIHSVLVVIGERDATAEAHELQGRPITYLGYNGSRRNPKAFYRTVRRLREIARQVRADIVHSHLWPAAQICGWAVDARVMKHVVHIHDGWPWLRERTIRSSALRCFTRRALSRSHAAFISVSRRTWEYSSKHLRLEGCVHQTIHNGVAIQCVSASAASEDRRDHSRFRVGVAARLSREKGHKYLLAAIADVVKKGLDVELRLAGDGPLLADIIKTAEDSGLRERVRFFGQSRDILAFLDDLDLFVLPSLSEGLPLSVLEAMAVGLPVVATDVGGISEIVHNGETGLLIAPGDVGGLSSAIESMIRNPVLRETVARNGSELVKREHQWALTAERVVRYYKELLDRR